MKINGPGSWHDAAMSKSVFAKLQYRTPDDSRIIGDTASPTNTDVRGRIRTPTKASFRGYPSDPAEIRKYIRFNRLGSAGFRVGNEAFARLVRSSKATSPILSACRSASAFLTAFPIYFCSSPNGGHLKNRCVLVCTAPNSQYQHSILWIFFFLAISRESMSARKLPEDGCVPLSLFADHLVDSEGAGDC